MSTDGRDMITVFTWEIEGKILVDVFSYPGDNQTGYIYYNNIPVIENGDMSLEYLDEFKFDAFTLIDFEKLRDVTLFGERE